VLALIVLLPMSMVESMKNLSYISIISILSIFTSLAFLCYTALQEISVPTFDKDFKWLDPWGIPYFFGTVMFMFEGNGLALEIYYQMNEAILHYNYA